MASSVPPLALCARPWAAIDGITSTIRVLEVYISRCGLAIADLESSSHAEDSVVRFLWRKALDG